MCSPQEENGRAALLLEQAAYALLCLPMPAKRKFAFQMVSVVGLLITRPIALTQVYHI